MTSYLHQTRHSIYREGSRIRSCLRQTNAPVQSVEFAADRTSVASIRQWYRYLRRMNYATELARLIVFSGIIDAPTDFEVSHVRRYR